MDKRIYALCAASALAVTFIAAKVLGLGIIKHDDYTRAVLAQQKTTCAVAPIRGTIVENAFAERWKLAAEIIRLDKELNNAK